MPSEPVDEVVLTPVRFVRNDDDVASIREHGVAIALFLGKELLDGCEHHAPGRDRELRPQVGAVRSLYRRLTQQISATGEGAEELVVEVIPVCEHNDRWIFHRRMQDHAAGIENHRQTLTGALCVPDHAHAPVAGLTPKPLLVLSDACGFCRSACSSRVSRPERFFDRNVHCVKLVVAGNLLIELSAAKVLEDNEVAHQLEETTFLEHSLQQDLKLSQALRSIGSSGYRSPGFEPFLPRAEGADACENTVGHDQRHVGDEECGDLAFVGL